MPGPNWQKSPPELVELFGSVAPGPPVETRQMFGYPAAFLNGNLFISLHQDRFVVRLGEQERAKLVTLGASAFEPMPGRAMKEYLVLPESILSDRTKLNRWVKASLTYAQSLPPKVKKKPKAKG